MRGQHERQVEHERRNERVGARPLAREREVVVQRDGQIKEADAHARKHDRIDVRVPHEQRDAEHAGEAHDGELGHVDVPVQGLEGHVGHAHQGQDDVSKDRQRPHMRRAYPSTVPRTRHQLLVPAAEDLVARPLPDVQRDVGHRQARKESPGEVAGGVGRHGLLNKGQVRVRDAPAARVAQRRQDVGPAHPRAAPRDAHEPVQEAEVWHHEGRVEDLPTQQSSPLQVVEVLPRVGCGREDYVVDSRGVHQKGVTGARKEDVPDVGETRKGLGVREDQPIVDAREEGDQANAVQAKREAGHNARDDGPVLVVHRARLLASVRVAARALYRLTTGKTKRYQFNDVGMAEGRRVSPSGDNSPSPSDKSKVPEEREDGQPHTGQIEE